MRREAFAKLGDNGFGFLPKLIFFLLCGRHQKQRAEKFTKQHGKTPGEFFGTFEYTHKKSGRKVVNDVFPFHNWAFQEGLLHAENLGGDIEMMLGKRAIIGAFPWRYEGLEGCPCRIVAFLDCGENVEAVGDAAKAILGH